MLMLPKVILEDWQVVQCVKGLAAKLGGRKELTFSSCPLYSLYTLADTRRNVLKQ